MAVYSKAPVGTLNFLETPVLNAVLEDGARHPLTLPGLYAAFMADRVNDMPALRPHQRQPLHAFLAQIGALALLKSACDAPPKTEADWAALLRGLILEHPDDAPRSLVVEDVFKPALLQPPIPEGRIDALKDCEETPDASDRLVASKNHDLKAARMLAASPEQWFFALLTRQTMDGFLGQGNYGISRMNSGFGSRPMVGLVPKGGWGAWLRRDIVRLVDLRHESFSGEGLSPYKLTGGI